MNFRLIGMLALLGVVVAGTTIVGLVHAGWETGLNLAVAVLIAGVLANRAPGKFFLHGLLAGALCSALTSICQGMFMSQYLAHNPKAVDAFKALPAGMSPQVLVIIAIPLTAGLAGIVTGLLTLLWAKFSRPKPAGA